MTIQLQNLWELIVIIIQSIYSDTKTKDLWLEGIFSKQVEVEFRTDVLAVSKGTTDMQYQDSVWQAALWKYQQKKKLFWWPMEKPSDFMPAESRE